eukprot:8294982-Pyramimonas_sp.AAC.1
MECGCARWDHQVLLVVPAAVARPYWLALRIDGSDATHEVYSTRFARVQLAAESSIVPSSPVAPVVIVTWVGSAGGELFCLDFQLRGLADWRTRRLHAIPGPRYVLRSDVRKTLKP